MPPNLISRGEEEYLLESTVWNCKPCCNKKLCKVQLMAVAHFQCCRCWYAKLFSTQLVTGLQLDSVLLVTALWAWRFSFQTTTLLTSLGCTSSVCLWVSVVTARVELCYCLMSQKTLPHLGRLVPYAPSAVTLWRANICRYPSPYP